MLHLGNHELRIELLDPVTDAVRLGPRYGWGGYIWQVHDLLAGPLTTGPEWPEPAPSAFNGQGLPESFRHRSLEGVPLTWHGERGVALGAGELAMDSRGNIKLVKPCEWKIAANSDQIEFVTRHEAVGFNYELRRTIGLSQRQVRSTTRLTNASPVERLALEWFAHPFFPLVDGNVRSEIPAGATLDENPGFLLDARSLRQRRRFVGPDDGHMERSLRLPANQPLRATLDHPTVEFVRFETSFAPTTCIIWGNDRTFSFEPYFALDLAPGEMREWSVIFTFGPARDQRSLR